MSRADRPLRVAVVEDNPRYRESLVTLFSMTPRFELVAAFASASAALERFDRPVRPGPGEEWDLVLMDVDLPGIRGIEATRRIKRLAPSLLVVVLTVFEEPAVILDAICAGADGYLLKRTPPGELLEQLEVVADGGAPLTAGVARTVLALMRETAGPAGARTEPGIEPGLSPRERDVLRGLVEGLAYKQVADRLGLSIDTVRTHVRGLYRKLQVHSVAEAIGRALRERLV